MTDLKIINFPHSEYKTKIYEGETAIMRLYDIGGLTYELITEPFMKAINIKNAKSRYAMPMEKHLTILFESVKELRKSLIAKGWTYEDKKNFNQTIAPNGKYIITVSSGDYNTGRHQNSITKNKKGASTASVIEMNNLIQLKFDIPNLEKYPIKYSHQLALNWFVMFYCKGHSIQIEVSLPRYYDKKKKKVVGWYERILLPDIYLDKYTIKNTPNILNNIKQQDILKPLCNNKKEDIDITKKQY